MRFCDGCGAPQLVEQVSLPAQAQFTEITNFITRFSSLVSSKLRIGSDILLALVLFAVTALTILPFFSGDFTQNWGSIESAYISDSIFIVNNFPNLAWYPLWYGGLPFHLSYPPLFVSLVAVLHTLSGLSIGQSYRILGGLGYSTAPVALYLLAKYLTKNSLASFFAGLTYSLVPTFVPVIAPSHVAVLAVYGEAPHLFGFTLALLAVLQLLRCMNRPTWFGCLAASLLLASVALANLVALFALALLIVVAVTTEVLYRTKRATRAFFLSALVGFGFASFQYDLRFIISSAQISGSTGAALRYSIILFPTLILGLIIARKFLSGLLSRQPRTKPIFFVLLWVFLLFLILSGRAHWFNLPALAPQPHRYAPEFDAGVSLLIGMLVMSADRLVARFGAKRDLSFKRALRIGLMGLILTILLINSIFTLPYSLTITQPTMQLSNVPEYRIANWLSSHVTDESIFATGTVQFWLNVFSNARQIKGGSDQGATNTWYDAIAYQIITGRDPEVSILWAQAWNMKYIVVTFPNASTPYHDYTYPDKFNHVLPLRYYFEGNGVFEVPLPRPALIEAISAQGATSLSPIAGVLDTRGLSAYVNLTQTQPDPTGGQVTYTIVNPDIIQVSVSGASPDTAILVKMTYDRGWQAILNGASVGISQFGPDFMVTYPQTQGNYQLTFRFQRSDGETIGLYLTMATMAIVILGSAILYRRKRRSRRSPVQQPTGSEKTHDNTSRTG